MREREDANRTREAGHLDEIQGVAANMLNSDRNGAVGFIVWLDRFIARKGKVPKAKSERAQLGCKGRTEVLGKMLAATHLSLCGPTDADTRNL